MERTSSQWISTECIKYWKLKKLHREATVLWQVAHENARQLVLTVLEGSKEGKDIKGSLKISVWWHQAVNREEYNQLKKIIAYNYKHFKLHSSLNFVLIAISKDFLCKILYEEIRIPKLTPSSGCNDQWHLLADIWTLYTLTVLQYLIAYMCIFICICPTQSISSKHPSSHSPGAEVGPVCNQMSPHFDS